MPLTPLHLAAGLPLRKHISMKAFIAVNLAIDVEPVTIVFFGMEGNLHQSFHTLLFSSVIALFIWITGASFGGNNKQWLLGSFFGSVSHVLLDAIGHSDVYLFAPFIEDNPLYLDAYHEVSIACAVVLVYYLALWVQSLGIAKAADRSK